MNVQHISNPFPYIIVRDLYDSGQLESIWEELKFLGHTQKLSGPADTGSATKPMEGSEEKKYLKQNNGVWLDNVFADRKYSNILQINRKLFALREIIWMNHPHWYFHQDGLLKDTTLISYYENTDYYHTHKDTAYFTAITWFFKEPKKFKGGNFYFDDYDIEIEVENNKMVIFPSVINHSVDELKMSSQDLNKNLGRYSMVQFGNF